MALAAFADGCGDDSSTAPTGTTSTAASGGSATGAGGASTGGAGGQPGGSHPGDDHDQDGFTVAEGDCDDEDPEVNPGRTEIAGNDKDDDCDGLSFGTEQSLGQQGRQLDVAIEADGDLHLTYTRDTTHVYYRRQAGGLWETQEREVPVAGTYYPSWWPHVGVDSSGTAHFGWADWQANVWYTQFTSSFAALTAAITDTDDGGDTNRNDLVVLADDSVLIAAQSDFAIEYDVKTPSGAFGADTPIFTDTNTEPQFPSLAVSPTDGSVHCVFDDNEVDGGLRYTHGTLDGTWSWSTPNRPAGDGGGCCANASSVTVDSQGEVHVAWIAWRSATHYSDLLYARRNAAGNWSPIRTFISTPDYFTCHASAECNLAQVAVAANGTVLIVFANGGAASELSYFVKFPGVPWSADPTPVAFIDANGDMVNDAIPQDYPAVVARGDTFHILWSDGRGAIYHRAIESVPVGSLQPQP